VVNDASSGFRHVVRNGRFVQLWANQGLSQVAQNTINFTLLLLVREIVETQNVRQANTAIGLLVLAFSAPAIIFSPIAGVVVERSDKRTVMRTVAGLRVLTVVGYLALDPQWSPFLTLTLLYLITFFQGAIGQFFGPAQAATIPRLVTQAQLMTANALFNLTFTAAQLFGFAVVGPIGVKLLGVDRTLMIALALYVLTTVLAAILPPLPPLRAVTTDTKRHPFRRFLGEAREGLSFVIERPILVKAITYLSLSTATYLMIAALGPEFIVSVLQLPSEDIVYVVAPAALGVVVGALIVGRLTHWVRPARLVDIGLIGAGIFLAAFALTQPLADRLGLIDELVPTSVVVVSVGFAALLGVSNALIIVPSQTLLQRGAPEHGLARVYSTYFTVSNIASFAPVLFASAIADVFGTLRVMIVIALLLVVIGLWNLRRGVPPLPDAEPDQAAAPA
jgi:MFS family permease